MSEENPCFYWFTNDVQRIMSLWSAEKSGAWTDCVTSAMTTKENVGTSVSTLSVLANRWRVPDERALYLLAEIATEVADLQNRITRILFGYITVEIELDGVWTRLQTSNVRRIVDAKLHPLTPVKIHCPKVVEQVEKRARWNDRKTKSRKSVTNATCHAKRLEKCDKSGLSQGEGCDKGVCHGDIYHTDHTITTPIPFTGELKNENTTPPENTTTPIPGDRAPGDPESMGKPDTGKNKEARKKARAGVEAKKRLQAATTHEMDRVGSWFGHAEGTGWTLAEADAWRQLAGIVQPEDFEALEWYYGQARKRHGARRYDRQTEDGFYLCRHKGTLLNKWTKQVAMAMDRREKDRHAGSDELRA
jgi:hypothetical protein